MTDRLTPADVLRIVADGIWTPREGATTVYGEEAMRAGIAHRLRDEAARREAEYERPKPTPGVKFYCSAVPSRASCWGSNCPPDGCGYPVDARREAERQEPCANATGSKGYCERCGRSVVTQRHSECDAPAPFVTDHKWLDPECHASGCQTLILKAEIEKLKDERDKYMWQARDTCRRAEAAEAREKRLREALKWCISMLREHPRLTTNIVYSVDLDFFKEYEALAQNGGNDDAAA